MRSARSNQVLILFVLGVGLAAANLWYAALRSTIPLELRGEVTKKERGIEKSPGVDDVYLVTLDRTRVLQVDRTVYDSVSVSQSIDKSAWSNKATFNGRTITLAWSADFYGLVWVAVVALLAMIFCAVPLEPFRSGPSTGAPTSPAASPNPTLNAASARPA